MHLVRKELFLRHSKQYPALYWMMQPSKARRAFWSILLEEMTLHLWKQMKLQVSFLKRQVHRQTSFLEL